VVVTQKKSRNCFYFKKKRTVMSSTLTLSSRLYSYVKASAITSTLIAAVELMHNTIAIYMSTGQVSAADVSIDYNEQTNTMLVVDNGVGVAPDRMIVCFGTVGEYTAAEETRSFFARGGKDCSALGTCTFTSFHVDGWSQLILKRDNTYQIHYFDEKPTHNYGIVGDTGLSVRIDVDDDLFMSDLKHIRALGIYYSVRLYIRAHCTSATLTHTDKNGVVSEPYDMLTLPIEMATAAAQDTKTVDATIKLKSGHTGTIQLFTMEPSNHDMSLGAEFQTHGIMINSMYGSHELTTIHPNITSHRMVKRVRGVLTLPFIESEMQKFDEGGATIPIVDPSRHGINRSHPDIAEAYTIVYRLLQYQLELLLDEETKTEDDTEVDISDVFNDLDIKDLVEFTTKSTGIQSTAADLLQIIDRLETNVDATPEDNILDPDDVKEDATGDDPIDGDILGGLGLVVKFRHTDDPHDNIRPSLTDTVVVPLVEHSWFVRDGTLTVELDVNDPAIARALTAVDGGKSSEYFRTVISVVAADVLDEFIVDSQISDLTATSKAGIVSEVHTLMHSWYARVQLALYKHLTPTVLMAL
jgi:hypothetical protein